MSFSWIGPAYAKKLAIKDAAILFVENKVTAIIVGRDVQGIFTEHDFIKHVASEQSTTNVFVFDTMTPNPVVVDHSISDASALAIMRSAKFRHLPVVNADKTFNRVLDVVSIGRSQYNQGKSMTSQLAKKLSRMYKFFSNSANQSQQQHDASSVGWGGVEKHETCEFMAPTDTVLMAAKKMLKLRESALLVAEKGSVIGIVTESDIVKKIVARGATSSTQLCVIMTENPTMIQMDDPNTKPLDALALMMEKKFRHLPLVTGREHHPAGILDVLQLCQGCFGKEMNGNVTAKDPIQWIVRGEDCYHSRVAAASKDLIEEEETETKETTETTETTEPTETTESKTVPKTPSAPATTMSMPPIPQSPEMNQKIETFKNYLQKARKKRKTAEEHAQRNNFEGATKNYSLALRFVLLAQKYIPLDLNNEMSNDEKNKMTMTIRAMLITITMRRLESYHIDGSTKEALNDVVAVLDLLDSKQYNSTVEARDLFCSRIGISYDAVCSTRVELLIELDRFQDAVQAMRESSESSSSLLEVEEAIIKLLSLHLVALKTTSNELYQEKSFYDAVTGYTSAMRVMSDADTCHVDLSSCKEANRSVLLANRAACYMSFVPRDFNNAKKDLEECVLLNAKYVKGWERLVRLHVEEEKDGNGNVNGKESKRVAQEGLSHHPLNKVLLQYGNEKMVNNVTTKGSMMTGMKIDKENDSENSKSAGVEKTEKGAASKGIEQTAEEKVLALKKLMGL